MKEARCAFCGVIPVRYQSPFVSWTCPTCGGHNGPSEQSRRRRNEMRHPKAPAYTPLVDMTGRTCGNLTVIKRAPEGVGYDSRAWWRCRCTCGTEVDVPGNRLRNGRTTHCGCKRERPREAGRQRYVEYNGVTKRAFEWADIYGIRSKTLCSRLSRGWTVEEALTTPVKPHKTSSETPSTEVMR